MKEVFLLIPFLYAILCCLACSGRTDVEKGDAIYAEMCVSCHGQNAEGNETLNSPRLAGQEEWYLRTQILKFKRDIRGTHEKDTFGRQMVPMAKALTDKGAVDDVVASIRTMKTEEKLDRSTGDVARGKSRYAVCIPCHGDRAQGNVDQKAPQLNEQHAWYMSRQLKNFKEGIRGAHPQDIEGKLMRPFSSTLGDDQAIEDVVAYIQSLK